MTSRLALLAGMTTVLVASSVSAARAADELGLSADGVHWSLSLSQPLFDSSQLWVPGDSETARFYVRNQGGTPADLTIDILGSTTSDLFDTGDLHVTAVGGGATWVTVSERGEHRLLTRPDLADGAAVPIDVTVALDADSTNVSQFRSAQLDFRVTLAEVVADGTGTDDDGSGGSPLPGTGSTASPWILPIGAMLLGLGLALVSRRRSERSERPHV
jgi:LPXTG-motif cell wall-anchored protein